MTRHVIRDFIRKLGRTRDRVINDVLHDEYARRAFANNAFDGVLTFLGILMGNLVLTEFNPLNIIKIGLSTCLAIGMSGAFGRFLSERAERKRFIKQIEKDMFSDLSGSSLEREAKRKTITISIIDGVSPALAALVPLSPFFFAQATVIPAVLATVASFSLVFVVLFGLGVFLGKTSQENEIMYGMSVVAVGFVTSLIIFLASIYFH